MTTDHRPKAPPGTARLQTKAGPSEYLTHLVRRNESGGTPGPTLCGLTRFDSEMGADDADLKGWCVEGGVFGPDVLQTTCLTCWQATDNNPAPAGSGNG